MSSPIGANDDEDEVEFVSVSDLSFVGTRFKGFSTSYVAIHLSRKVRRNN